MSDLAKPPIVYVFGGPNGAGKSTISQPVLDAAGGGIEFVNADVIARGLSGAEPERVAFAAGRIMLARLRELAADRATFAFESTLASRTFAPFLAKLVTAGYRFHLHYVFLPTAETAVRRVAHRYASGGHSVPADTIVRRYSRSVGNCRSLYMPLAQQWRMYDNGGTKPTVVASGGTQGGPIVYNHKTWARFSEVADACSADNNSADDAG